MNWGDAFELYELLFCVAMAFMVMWFGTGQLNLRRRGRTGWVYTLNRISFWGWICALACAMGTLAGFGW